MLYWSITLHVICLSLTWDNHFIIALLSPVTSWTMCFMWCIHLLHIIHIPCLQCIAWARIKVYLIHCEPLFWSMLELSLLQMHMITSPYDYVILSINIYELKCTDPQHIICYAINCSTMTCNSSCFLCELTIHFMKSLMFGKLKPCTYWHACVDVFTLCVHTQPLNNISVFNNAKPAGFLVLILKGTQCCSLSF